MSTYKPSERYHEVTWMLRHSKDLEEKAIRTYDTSKVIYCCLELRNILEMIEFHLLITSVSATEHESIAKIAKTHRGNEKANKHLKSISFKEQKFYEILCEQINEEAVFFDLKKSNNYKADLSQYLHTSTKIPKEMEFSSKFIQEAFPLICEVREFIENSLINEGDSYIVKNIEFKSLKVEDKDVLQDWKKDKIDEVEMGIKIKANFLSRKMTTKHLEK